jgi:hypothetical protein
MEISRQDIQEGISPLNQQQDKLTLYLLLAEATVRNEWKELEEKMGRYPDQN